MTSGTGMMFAAYTAGWANGHDDAVHVLKHKLLQQFLRGKPDCYGSDHTDGDLGDLCIQLHLLWLLPD
jgi:hypothetical protein